MTRGKWVCLCQRKTEPELLTFLRAHPRVSFDRFRKKTGAGVTCESCVRDLLALYEGVAAERARAVRPAPPRGQPDLFGDGDDHA